MKYYIRAIKNYAVFEGRTTRKEYWMFMLFHVGISVFLSCMTDLAIGDAVRGMAMYTNCYALFMVIPSISISVRRLHDTDKSGWWFLMTCIPFIGLIYWIIVFTRDSDITTNKYGPDPKRRIVDVEAEEVIELVNVVA